MRQFDAIFEAACARKNGESELRKLMPMLRCADELAIIGDDRYLSEMTRCVFQAGFVWRIVNQKWNNFEELFFGFPPEKIVLLSPEQLERFGQNKCIIRNMQKVVGVQHNARFVVEVANQYGSFGKFIANWPDDNHIGLFAYLKKHGNRLGGMTGQRVLRNMGKDTFVVTGDVVRALQKAGLDIKDNPSSKRELTRIQDQFNHWHRETGLAYGHLSRICAYSV